MCGSMEMVWRTFLPVRNTGDGGPSSNEVTSIPPSSRARIPSAETFSGQPGHKHTDNPKTLCVHVAYVYV
jgi:hypothetical protein